MYWKTIEKKAKNGLIELHSLKLKNKKGFYYATIAVDVKTKEYLRLTTKNFIGGIQYLLSIGAVDKRKTT